MARIRIYDGGDPRDLNSLAIRFETKPNLRSLSRELPAFKDELKRTTPVADIQFIYLCENPFSVASDVTAFNTLLTIGLIIYFSPVGKGVRKGVENAVKKHVERKVTKWLKQFSKPTRRKT
jgi:hypothetical protein